MNPNENYSLLAVNTIGYLFIFLENYCGAYDLGIELAESEYILIEESAYNSIVK